MEKTVAGCRKIVSRQHALDLILDCTHPLETIDLPLEETLGYAAGKSVYASADIPGFDRSAMDGYAICSNDAADATAGHPVRLKVVGEIRPSTAEPVPVESGQAVRIMTGGPIPAGADAVVKEEDVRCGPGVIEVPAAVRPSLHVWAKGKDINAGTLIVEQGGGITPAVLSILSSLQISRIAVTRKPGVCVLAVGNELIDIHDTARDHKIVASNIYMLSALIKEHGSRVKYAKISKNDKDSIREHIEKGLGSDILITTGGSSRAHSDLTRALMEEIGVDLMFSGVSMRPGKGTSFGLYDGKPVFCLPGTPSAVYVVFFALVLPALLQLTGLRTDWMSRIKAVLESDIDKKPGTEHLVQGFVTERDSSYSVLPLAGPDAGVFPAMGRANALIMVAPDEIRLNRGRAATVQLLNPREVSLPQKGVREQEDTMPPIVSIVGKSDSGKTTLLEKLVPELRARGYRIGTIKHDVHGFDIDHEGKDSWRHKQAGARTVAISSPNRVAVVKDVETEQTIDGLASKYFEEADIILTEGYKKEQKPKIEIFRSRLHDTPLCEGDSSLVALVSDTPLDLGAPRFELDDIEGLADLVEQRFLAKPRRQ
ncbi:MAG: molybdopterin-guanine dinucleotide biosynthesis protein B [Desulfobacterales bacterium]|nr:molybdopterin-guanine dinucleotide biosynthesis protein B [Desulfobacterales bacterium]